MARDAVAVRDRLEEVLSRIARHEDPAIFTRIYADTARAAADAADRRAAAGESRGPLDGKLVTIKDLFDVAGETTTAGSAILRDAPPATRDAKIVERLRLAGAVILGKTNMTEFAFSGLGLNPHWGTPGNAHDRSRIPGGSSSGAGVAAALGFGDIAIGTDTGGSVRIPAALNGIVGFKPTAERVPRDGAFPLSYTLNSIGPLAKTVALCAAADGVMAGEAPRALVPAPLSGLTIAVAEIYLEGTEPAVLSAFETSLRRLSAAGARIVKAEIDDLVGAMRAAQTEGPISPVEAAEIHAAYLEERQAEFDPQVLLRIRQGQRIPAPRYVATLRRRRALIAALDERLPDGTVLAMPTTPIVAPRLDQIDDDASFQAFNTLVLRNPSFGNFFDLCALSLPMPTPGLPMGLMLTGRHGSDAGLLATAAGVEACLH